VIAFHKSNQYFARVFKDTKMNYCIVGFYDDDSGKLDILTENPDYDRIFEDYRKLLKYDLGYSAIEIFTVEDTITI